MPIADNGERREALGEGKSTVGRSERAEDIIHQSGGGEWSVGRSQRDVRGSTALLEQVGEDGVVTALGGRLGKQAMALGKVGIVCDIAEAMHAVGQLSAMAVREGAFVSVPFELETSSGVSVEGSLEVGDAGLEDIVGQSWSSNPVSVLELTFDSSREGIHPEVKVRSVNRDWGNRDGDGVTGSARARAGGPEPVTNGSPESLDVGICVGETNVEDDVVEANVGVASFGSVFDSGSSSWRWKDHDLTDVEYVGVGNSCTMRPRVDDRRSSSKPGSSHDGREAKAADVDPREGVGREGDRYAVVAAAALEAHEEIVQGAGVAQHGGVASERVADLDAVGFVGVDVDQGHWRVGGKVEEVLGADGAVSETRSSTHDTIQNISDVVWVGDSPLVGVVEVGVNVEVGHGENQPGQDS